MERDARFGKQEWVRIAGSGKGICLASMIWVLVVPGRLAASPAAPPADVVAETTPTSTSGSDQGEVHNSVPVRIVVRTYALAATKTFASALSVAADILERAGVHVEWVPCEETAERSATCDSPLNRNERALRVVTLQDRSVGRLRALGFALIDPQQKTGTMATVYLDRVRWLAQASGTSESILLGRAIAHEIGHLLIGSNRHSATGLMRAVWSRADLEGGQRDQWLFAPADVTAIRNGFRAGAADRPSR